MVKRGTRVLTSKYNNKIVKSKRSQLQISFGMIFSIILIIIFIALAVYVIVVVLGMKKCAGTGLFKEDLQQEIDRAWYSDDMAFSKDFSLPSQIQKVCFVNVSKFQKGEYKNEYDEFRKFGSRKLNMYFSPLTEACSGQQGFEINHIALDKITETNNPYCLVNKNGAVSIKIEKAFNEAFVKIS